MIIVNSGPDFCSDIDLDDAFMGRLPSYAMGDHAEHVRASCLASAVGDYLVQRKVAGQGGRPSDRYRATFHLGLWGVPDADTHPRALRADSK